MICKNLFQMIAIALLWCMFPIQKGFAQAPGQLSGKITDTVEGGIDWAQIVISNDIEKHEIKVDKQSNFKIMLPAGEYLLSAQAKAFKSSQPIKVKLVAGETTQLNFSLEVDSTNATCLLIIENDQVTERDALNPQEKKQGKAPKKN